MKSKTFKNNMITYCMVIVVFVIVQALLSGGKIPV